MCDTGYSVRELVADLRLLAHDRLDDAAMARAVPDLVKRLGLMRPNSLRPYMCVAGEGAAAGLQALHAEPDHTLPILLVSWMAGGETPPPDHPTAARISRP